MKPSLLSIGHLGILILLILPTIAGAGPLEGSCRLGPQPAASLLLPYFEVDLGNPEGSNTLMSIGTSVEVPTLARVTLWTDWAIPVYSFDVALPPHGVQTLNLRDVVQRGKVPVTGFGTPVKNCASPLENPPLNGAVRSEIQKWLTGQPASSDGLCRGSSRGETSVAVGFATVDILRDCSETVRYPTDEGYFTADDTGLAAPANWLYGDWFLVDPSRDLAQGAELVHLVADPEFFEANALPTFYAGLSNASTFDARLPLSSEWQARFFQGGAFDGGTEFLLWLGALEPGEPLECGLFPSFRDILTPVHQFRVRTEGGEDLSDVTPLLYRSVPALTRRFSLEDLTLAEIPSSGLLEITSFATCGTCSPPEHFPLQAWVIPLYSAEQRFSVGVNAVRLDDLCVEEP
jgi:hypothetical protein